MDMAYPLLRARKCPGVPAGSKLNGSLALARTAGLMFASAVGASFAHDTVEANMQTATQVIQNFTFMLRLL
jgi:hypothetical protein